MASSNLIALSNHIGILAVHRFIHVDGRHVILVPNEPAVFGIKPGGNRYPVYLRRCAVHRVMVLKLDALPSELEQHGRVGFGNKIGPHPIPDQHHDMFGIAGGKRERSGIQNQQQDRAQDYSAHNVSMTWMESPTWIFPGRMISASMPWRLFSINPRRPLQIASICPQGILASYRYRTASPIFICRPSSAMRSMAVVSIFARTAPGGMLCSPREDACEAICSRSMRLTWRRLGFPVVWLRRPKYRGSLRMPLPTTNSTDCTMERGAPERAGCKCNEATWPGRAGQGTGFMGCIIQSCPLYRKRLLRETAIKAA